MYARPIIRGRWHIQSMTLAQHDI